MRPQVLQLVGILAFLQEEREREREKSAKANSLLLTLKLFELDLGTIYDTKQMDKTTR